MQRILHRVGKQFFLSIFVVGLLLLIAGPFLGSAETAQNQVIQSNVTASTLTFSPDENLTMFTDLYQVFIEDENIPTHAIYLNGTPTTMLELPIDSIAVQLPDNRIGLRFANETVSVLPNGTNVSVINNKPVIILPDQHDVLSVSDIVVSPVKQFLTSTYYVQSVDALDTYMVTVVFLALSQPNSEISLGHYTVAWGDGTYDIYSTHNITATHQYHQSGTYEVTINATDDYGFAFTTIQPYTVEYEGPLRHSYFWVEKNKEPVAVTTTAGVSLMTIGAIALTETGKYKLLMMLALFMPLYTRIQKEDVLDQFVRGQIYGFIKTNPGVHYNQIRRQVGVKNGTLSYHLGVLEKTELIHSRREGLKYRAFYPSTMNFPQAERFRLTELQVQIITSVKDHPGMTQKEIASKLHLKPQTVNYNVKVLDQAGLIQLLKDGRKTGVYPTEDAPDASFQ